MMDADELAKQLHDKATCGVPLSSEEHAQLDAWYARQDTAESAMFAQTSPPQTLVALQEQVDTTVVQLLTVTQRVRDLTLQNDALRRDIAVRSLSRTLRHEREKITDVVHLSRHRSAR